MPIFILSFTTFSSSNPHNNPSRLKEKLSHVPVHTTGEGWRCVTSRTCYRNQDGRCRKACQAHFAKNRNKLYDATSPSPKGKAEIREGPRKVGKTRCLCCTVPVGCACVTQHATGDLDTVWNLAEGRMDGQNFQEAQRQQMTTSTRLRLSMITSFALFVKKGCLHFSSKHRSGKVPHPLPHF